MKLEHLAPERAVEEYLKSRKQDASKATVRNHRYCLKQFLQWCDEEDLTNMNNLSGRRCEEFKNWRISEGGLNSVTLENQLRTFRVFIRWCESNEAVEEGVADKILIPNVSKGEKVREELVTPEEANNIIDYLCRFHWANVSHIIFHLAWHTGCRRRAIYALDVEDWHSDEQYIAFRHRPESETPLKLGEEGERNVTIADNRLVEALNDWIERNRHDVTDDHGRKPLLTSSQGRLHYSSIQWRVYKVTRPCFYSGECPHNRVIDECEGTYSEGYSKCPSSKSPHPVRRGAITAHLNDNIPKEIASERMSVSVDTLEEHYDARTKEEKRQSRLNFLEEV